MSGAAMVKLLHDLCVHPDTAAGLLLSLPYTFIYHIPAADVSHRLPQTSHLHAVNGKLMLLTIASHLYLNTS
ncbi:hypothetical protein EB796_003884 [Bugula neritina]|uniref:Uncharacterized protein n=1 Tax=Bugula neritina TaxID=10212 RepID=A0A7J7KGL3_BUGNE|nr:hypothetical protein EB796_003884 [Bugula neritina]